MKMTIVSVVETIEIDKMVEMESEKFSQTDSVSSSELH